MGSEILKLDCTKGTAGVIEESGTGHWDGLPPELLNLIFNQLPVADLLPLSVVSKAWKKASRDVLKRSRECYAYIKHFPQDVHHLIHKMTSTELMEMVNGLHIHMRKPKDNNKASLSPSSASPPPFWLQEVGSPTSNPKWTETRRKLINLALSGQMRYLTLDMEDEWKENLSSPDDLLLLQQLVCDTSDSVEKLVIWQDECWDFMSSCGKEFSKLQVAHIQYEQVLQFSFLTGFLTAFAPNLEEITGWMLLVAINYRGNQLMLKRSKSLMVYHDRKIPEVYMEDYRCISGLRGLELGVCHCDSLDDDNTLFSMILKSLNTLQELQMYTPEFYNLFKTYSSTGLKFPNLRLLSLSRNKNMPVGDEMAILKQLNLPKLCPNLEQFELRLIDHNDHTDDVYNEEDWTPATLPNGADQSTVSLEIVLEYRGDRYPHDYLEFLKQIYPKINTVCMENWELGDSIYEMSSIFSDFPSLEYLEINPNYSCSHALDFQVDALLCGLSVQEVELLFNSCSMANDELKPFIVPIRSSLFNAKNLKELKISSIINQVPGAIVSWSRVIELTENLPARHVRSLKVTFVGTADLFNRLNRLRAFTTLLCVPATHVQNVTKTS